MLCGKLDKRNREGKTKVDVMWEAKTARQKQIKRATLTSSKYRMTDDWRALITDVRFRPGTGSIIQRHFCCFLILKLPH